MIALARASVRHRLPSFTATVVAIGLSSLVVGAFATLVEASFGDVSTADAETLVIMGAVVGGWGGMIALFSLVSTLGVAVQRRRTEIGLLRCIGATPRQVRRLLRTETLLVALVAATIGAILAWPAGRSLLAALREGEMISGDVQAADGLVALGATVVVVVVVCLLAAGLAARRVTGGAPMLALAEDAGPSRLRRWRVVVGLLLVAHAVAGGVVTVTVMADLDDPYAPMQTSGSASIVAGIGLALFAPALLGQVGALVHWLEGGGAGAALAALTANRRSALMAGVSGPVLVFTAAGTGTLMLVGIDARTLVMPPEMTRTEADTIALLNYVVVGMIALFAAIMVVNSLLAVVGDRAVEFGRLRLVGATPEQVRALVLGETLMVAVIGVGLGLVGALATVVPFGMAREEGPIPDGQLWLPVVVAVVATLLTVGAGRLAVNRALKAGHPADLVTAS